MNLKLQAGNVHNPFAFIIALVATIISGIAPNAMGQTIEILAPVVDQRVAEGRDYATWQLGNEWDMYCPDWNGLSGFPGDPVWDGRFTCDLVVSNSRCVANESFVNGSYFATSTSTCNNASNADPNLILVSPGPVAGVGLSNGRQFPIDTAIYRFVTVKMRTLNTSSNQGSMVFFQTSGDANDPFGRTGFKTVRPNGWQIVSFDLLEDVPASSQLTWDAQAEVIGLRFDPVPNDGIDFEIDWARLTADPSLAIAPESTVTIEWSSDGLEASAELTISAVDLDGAEIMLASGISVTAGAEEVDLSRLAPGEYRIRVTAQGVSDISTGRLLVNAAPEFHFIEPDKSGDEDRSYALDELANPWGPMDSADIITGNTAQTNLENIAFLGGELVADAPDGGASPGDPRLTFFTPVPIDTDRYRMLSFAYDLEMQPDQIGSVARVHWGTSTGVDPTPDTVSDDIRVRRGFNSYVLGDMGRVPDKNGRTDVWNGDLTVLRFDPHEVDDTREIVFRSLHLRPLDSADPIFVIRWESSDKDAEDPLLLSLYRDSDKDPENGNETLIGEEIDAQVTSEFVWDTTGTPIAEYWILAEASDGLNTVSRYATGPLAVGESGIAVLFSDGFESR